MTFFVFFHRTIAERTVLISAIVRDNECRSLHVFIFISVGHRFLVASLSCLSIQSLDIIIIKEEEERL